MNLFSIHGEVALRLPADGPGSVRAPNPSDEEALRSLEQLGFVRRTADGPAGPRWRWGGDHSAADRALLALLAQFRLDLEVGRATDDVVWMAAAVEQVSDGEFSREGFSGSGFSPSDAVRSCLGEFAEFQSWLYRPGDERRRCDHRELGQWAIDPWQTLGFTPVQRDRWRDFNKTWFPYDAIPESIAFEGEIDWSPVQALIDQSTHWLPSQICFGRYGGH